MVGEEVSGLNSINGFCAACAGFLAKDTLSTTFENTSLVNYLDCFCLNLR